jgi:hypothetical protein
VSMMHSSTDMRYSIYIPRLPLVQSHAFADNDWSPLNPRGQIAQSREIKRIDCNIICPNILYIEVLTRTSPIS